jgi:hypothetical protein
MAKRTTRPTTKPRTEAREYAAAVKALEMAHAEEIKKLEESVAQNKAEDTVVQPITFCANAIARSRRASFVASFVHARRSSSFGDKPIRILRSITATSAGIAPRRRIAAEAA